MLLGRGQLRRAGGGANAGAFGDHVGTYNFSVEIAGGTGSETHYFTITLEEATIARS